MGKNIRIDGTSYINADGQPEIKMIIDRHVVELFQEILKVTYNNWFKKYADSGTTSADTRKMLFVQVQQIFKEAWSQMTPQ